MTLRSDDRLNDEVLALLAEEAGYSPAAQPTQARPVPLPPRINDIVVGEADTGGAVGIDLQKLLEGRLLVQGSSGAGKSWTLRRLVEQTAERVQQVIIDPEGEFTAIAAAYGHLRVEAHRLDPASLMRLARRVREHRLSVVVDLSDLPRESQMSAAAGLLEGLVESPAEHWHTTLVVIDEAHLLAPFGGHSHAPPSVRNASIAAVTDLMSRGRKRGLAGVLATQRLTRLAKSVTSEAQNFLIGLNTLDLDVRRAAETIGWGFRRASDRLPLLQPGDFVAVGPAFSRAPVRAPGWRRPERASRQHASSHGPGPARRADRRAPDRRRRSLRGDSRGCRGPRELLARLPGRARLHPRCILRGGWPGLGRASSPFTRGRAVARVGRLPRRLGRGPGFGSRAARCAGRAGVLRRRRGACGPGRAAARQGVTVVTGLTPVSFSKPRGSQPRLSPRYVPGRHDARFWKDDEIAVLREHYPKSGVGACEARLPNRTRTTIYQQARKLGLKAPKTPEHRERHVYGPEMDDAIRQAWPELRGRGAVNGLADRLGVPRWWLSKQATRLGLSKPHSKEPRWTDAEDALMRKVPLHDPHRAAKVFREHGFLRTPTAIVVRAKRLDLSRRTHETLSARGAARILGVDDKTVTALCIAGDLKAGRRGTQRLVQQGGDAWAIEPADLRAYILDNLGHIDIRKVDKLAFVTLLVANDPLAEPAAPAAAPSEDNSALTRELGARIAELQAENARLTEQLAQAQQPQSITPPRRTRASWRDRIQSGRRRSA